MFIMKVFMLIGLVGYLLCWECDRLLTYTPNGRFHFSDIQDNEKLSKTFEGVDCRRLVVSMVLGVFAIAMFAAAYAALGVWCGQFSKVFSYILLPTVCLGFASGIAHHIFCGAIEWFYVRMNRTEQARKNILDFFKATSCTMYVYYIGLVIVSITWLVAVVSGMTTLPRWSCIFNVLPLFLVLSPFKIVGTGNLAGAIMFLGLLIFI